MAGSRAAQRDTTRSTPRPEAPASLEAMGAQLALALEGLAERYRRMGALAGARRAAVRGVNHRGLTAALTEEASLAGEIATLNQQRSQAARLIESAVGAPARGPATASWLGGRIGGETGERVLAAAAALREALAAVRDDVRADRMALSTLEAHARGILQAAAESQSHAGTYGRRGAFEARREQVVSSMDLTS